MGWGRWIVAAGATLAGLSVAAGAFAAHALQRRLSAELIGTFQTGARYQMYHALALVLVGILWSRLGGTALGTSAIAFITGIVLFSGSLYALAFSGPRWLGPVTPLGGVAFLLGWGALVVAAVTQGR